MIINLKPITIKNNEWQPQNQNFYHWEVIEAIISEEDLKNNMVCKKGVGFNSAGQYFSNVIFDCSEYNGEFIYLVNNKNIENNREWFFCYVVNKEFNTASKVVLTLKIDNVTSNYDLALDGSFRGQLYKERSNNEKQPDNIYHANMCSGIAVNDFIVEDSGIAINRNIDTFIERNLYKFTKSVRWPANINRNIEFEKKGNVFTTNKTDGDLIAYSPLQNISETLRKIKSLPLFKDLVKKYAPQINWEDDVWQFDNTSDGYQFYYQLLEEAEKADGASIANSPLADIDKIITDTNTKSWITAPKIFTRIGDSQIEYFEVNMPNQIIVDTSDHAALHNRYYLCLNDLLKIEIAPLKLKGRDIYGTRIVSSNEIIFKFYYEPERIDPFYKFTLDIANGIQDQSYFEWKRQKDIAYSSGMRGIAGAIPDLLKSSVFGLIGAGSSFAKKPGLGGLLGGLGIFEAIKLPFNLWKEKRQDDYEASKIINGVQAPENILLNEAIQKILPPNGYSFEWAYLSAPDVDGNPRGYTFYTSTADSVASGGGITDNLAVYVERPTAADIVRIKVDQEIYGAIFNRHELDNNNFLTWGIATDRLYWAGKILPFINPISVFALDDLNQTLAQGVMIFKNRQDTFNVLLRSTKGHFSITANNPVVVDNIDINSTNDDIIITDNGENKDIDNISFEPSNSLEIEEIQ